MLQVAREEVSCVRKEKGSQRTSWRCVVLVSARQQASAASYKAQRDCSRLKLALPAGGAELEEVAGRTRDYKLSSRWRRAISVNDSTKIKTGSVIPEPIQLPD